MHYKSRLLLLLGEFSKKNSCVTICSILAWGRNFENSNSSIFDEIITFFPFCKAAAFQDVNWPLSGRFEGNVKVQFVAMIHSTHCVKSPIFVHKKFNLLTNFTFFQISKSSKCNNFFSIFFYKLSFYNFWTILEF